MSTNKERTSSAAMRKLLLQSASKKEQEIQQIGSVAESTIPQPTIEQPIHEELKESAPVTETVQEPQPEQMMEVVKKFLMKFRFFRLLKRCLSFRVVWENV